MPDVWRVSLFHEVCSPWQHAIHLDISQNIYRKLCTIAQPFRTREIPDQSIAGSGDRHYVRPLIAPVAVVSIGLTQPVVWVGKYEGNAPRLWANFWIMSVYGPKRGESFGLTIKIPRGAYGQACLVESRNRRGSRMEPTSSPTSIHPLLLFRTSTLSFTTCPPPQPPVICVWLSLISDRQI